MTDFNAKAGLWFCVENGQIVEQSWGVPGPLSDQSIQTIRGAGWFPGVTVTDEVKDPIAYSPVTALTLAGDVIRVAVDYVEKPLAEVQAEAAKRINAEAADQFSRFDTALLRKVRTGEDLLPATQAALDFIAAAASAARAAIQAAKTVDDVLAVFPVAWVD